MNRRSFPQNPRNEVKDTTTAPFKNGRPPLLPPPTTVSKLHNTLVVYCLFVTTRRQTQYTQSVLLSLWDRHCLPTTILTLPWHKALPTSGAKQHDPHFVTFPAICLERCFVCLFVCLFVFSFTCFCMCVFFRSAVRGVTRWSLSCWMK